MDIHYPQLHTSPRDDSAMACGIPLLEVPFTVDAILTMLFPSKPEMSSGYFLKSPCPTPLVYIRYRPEADLKFTQAIKDVSTPSISLTLRRYEETEPP